MSNIEEIIQESVEDATLPADNSTETALESAEESTEATPQLEVSSPAEHSEDAVTETPEAPVEPGQETTPQDDFEKRYGIPAQSITGRENRIPYSRVKKITQKAAEEVAEAALGRKLAAGEKAVDVVKAHVARIPELETKVKDYEDRLADVGEFEKVMVNDAERFLQFLSTIPAYQPFFQFVDQALKGTAAPAQATSEAPATPDDPMPQPNHTLQDGSAVYDMDGLRNLMDWQARQVEKRITKQVEDRYKPIEERWHAEEAVKAIIPSVRAQAEEARTWPMFKENEDDIIQLLQKDPRISLERAYQKVVFPKMAAEKDKIRAEVLKELKQAPKATSAPVTPTKPVADVGPRSLEQVIADSLKGAKV